jgi:hypothetical protein
VTSQELQEDINRLCLAVIQEQDPASLTKLLAELNELIGAETAQGQRRHMPDIIRCPYCVERGHFMQMSARSSGNWFVCDRCGHLAAPKSNVQMYLRPLCRNTGCANTPNEGTTLRKFV